MIQEVRGIVLGTQDYREKDVLIRVATENLGLITLVAKSMRAINSKNAGAAMPFMESNFMIDYQEMKTMHVLTNASTLHAFRGLREDLHKQAFATYICDCIGYVLQVEADASLYEELRLALTALEQQKSARGSMLCFALFLAHACRLFGVDPYVDGCVCCGGEQKISTISISDGGFVCADCMEPTMDRFPKEQLLLFRLLMKAKFEHLPKIEAEEPTILAMVLFLFSFIKEHTSFTPVSEKFIRDILHLSLLDK